MKKALLVFTFAAAAASLAACGSSGSSAGGGNTITPPGGNPGPVPTQTPASTYLVQQALEPIQTAATTTGFFISTLGGGLPGKGTYACSAPAYITRSYSLSGNVANIETKHFQSDCATIETDVTDVDTYIPNATNPQYIQDQRTALTSSNGTQTTRNSLLQWSVPPAGTSSATIAQVVGSMAAGIGSVNGRSIGFTQNGTGNWGVSISNATLLLANAAMCPAPGSQPCYLYGNTGSVSNGAITQNGNGTYTYTGTHSEALYHGPQGSGLTFTPDESMNPPTLPACSGGTCFQTFSLSYPNGKAYGSGTATATLTFDGSGNLLQPTTVQATNTQGLTVSATLSSDGQSFSGTVTTSGGQQDATFSVDLNGNGSINYSDGTTATIHNFVVTG